MFDEDDEYPEYGPNGECWHQDECECDLVLSQKTKIVVREIPAHEFIGSCSFCSDANNASFELTGLTTSVRVCKVCAVSLKKQLKGGGVR